jgi:hypothetical protein
MKAYYLVASLPPLSIDEAAPWSPQDFVFHCQGSLDASDLTELTLIAEDRAGEAGSDFARWWHGLDTQLRNAQARARATRLGVDARPWQRMHEGFDVQAEQAVTEAMAGKQPLEREKQLDMIRWRALDDRTQSDPFGFEQVLAYVLRLRMVERWQRLDAAQGMERIEHFITENVDESLELQRVGGA